MSQSQEFFIADPLKIEQQLTNYEKDEMAELYKMYSEDSTTLKVLQDTSLSILRQTWRERQHGPQQRLTD